MMFMMPMPPMIRRDRRHRAEQLRHQVAWSRCGWRRSRLMLRTLKSSSAPGSILCRWRSRLRPRPARVQVVARRPTPSEICMHRARRQPIAPDRRRRAVSSGTTTTSSWSWPKPPWPFGCEHADHGERHAPEAHGLADRVVVAEQLAAHGVAEDHRLGCAAVVAAPRSHAPLRDLPVVDRRTSPAARPATASTSCSRRTPPGCCRAGEPATYCTSGISLADRLDVAVGQREAAAAADAHAAARPRRGRR